MNSDNLHLEHYWLNLVSLIKITTSVEMLKVLFLMINCFHSITDVKYFKYVDAKYYAGYI